MFSKYLKAVETCHGFDHDHHIICRYCEQHGMIIRNSINPMYLCKYIGQEAKNKNLDTTVETLFMLLNTLKYANNLMSNYTWALTIYFTQLTKTFVKKTGTW